MRAVLLTCTIALVALFSCSPDDGYSPPTPNQVASKNSAISSSGQPDKCKLVKLPGSDPQKPLEYNCSTQSPASSKTPDPKAVAKQQQYLDEWKKQAPSWAGLSPQQQEANRRALKEAVLGKGGQP